MELVEVNGLETVLQDKVIVAHGKRYNISQSRLIAEYDNSSQVGVLERVRERLYMSPRGKFFILAEGGARTQYGHTEGDKLVGSRDVIREVKKREAFRFADEHATDRTVLDFYFRELIRDA